MAGLGPRSAIERAEIGNSRPTVVRACALLDPVVSPNPADNSISAKSRYHSLLHTPSDAVVTRGASTGQGNLTPDFLYLPEGWPRHASENRIKNIKRLEVYHAIRGDLETPWQPIHWQPTRCSPQQRAGRPARARGAVGAAGAGGVGGAAGTGRVHCLTASTTLGAMGKKGSRRASASTRCTAGVTCVSM